MSEVVDALELGQIKASIVAPPVVFGPAAVPTDGTSRFATAAIERIRSGLVRTETVGPTLVVAMVLVLIIGAGFSTNPDNATVFVHFGRHFISTTHPPPGAVIVSGTGYDGQFFWAVAHDPLLLHRSTFIDIAGYRLDRILYPALAYALALGRPAAIPWTLLAVNVMAVLALTSAFGAYARGRGWSGWWALAIGLLPGLEFSTLADLSGPLAVTLMLGGLMAWQLRRRWLAALLLALAVLTREPMLLAVAAIAIETIARGWRQREIPGALKRLLRGALPALLLPTVAFVGWQAYIYSRHTPGTLPPASAFQWPLVSLIAQARSAIEGGLSLSNGWDLAYLTTIPAGLLAAFTLLRRNLGAPAIAALLFGLVVLILPFGSDWGYTRETAPMFAPLLLAGLGARARPVLAVSAVVALLGALLPIMIA